MKRTGITLFLVTLLHTLYAQYPHFRVINTSHGLAQNTVSQLKQDSRGFIWMVTQEGLQRYDGFTFKTYRFDPNNPKGLLTNNILDMYVAPDDKIWMATRLGVSVLNPVTDSIFHLSPKKGKWKLSTDGANAIAGTKEGLIIIGYSDASVDVLDTRTPGKISRITSQQDETNGLCRQVITSIVIDKKNNWWFSSWGDGICCYNPVTKKFTNFRDSGTDVKINYNNVRSIFCDSKNRIWVSCWNAGNNVIEQNPLRSYDCKNADQPYRVPVGLIWMFTEDKRGVIWAGAAEDGLLKFNPNNKEFKKYKGHPELQNTLPGNNVMCVLADANNVIWTGSWSGGLGLYNPEKEFVYSYRHVSDDPTSLGGNIVWSVHQGKSGKIWVGTDNGYVARFDITKGIFEPIEIAQQSSGDWNNRIMIQSIYEDSDGNLWLGTNGTGLLFYHVKDKTITNFNAQGSENIPAGDLHTCMAEDRDGKLWIGSSGSGINVWDFKEKKFTLVAPGTLPDSIQGRYITSLTFDGNNDPWIGTVDAGLIWLPRQHHMPLSFTPTEAKGGISSSEVYSVYWSKETGIWAGTSSGLNKLLRGGDFKTYTMSDGLPNNAILSMVGDKTGKLWLGTNNGMAVFNPRTGKIVCYGTADGFQSEYNQGSICRLTDGRILVGGIDGLNVIVPTRVSTGKQNAQVFFTDVQVLNKPYKGLSKNISYLNEITLSYRDYIFSLDFATTDYTDPSRVKFKYLLEGFNEDWVELGHRHSVSFTNLDAGDYVLKVMATNSEGKWGKSAATLKITITPPFWRTTWFYTLCIIIILLAVYAYIRQRERKLRIEKQVLEEKVEKRTVELRHEKEKVEEAHREIKDSINYAKRIQESILPGDDEIKKVLPQFFILFQPKDVVSGDFFWHYRIPGKQEVIIAAADCTGHGVPGAFMSMIGNTLLNEIVIQKKTYSPDKILNELHVGVRHALQQDRAYSDSRDGMDICLCHIDLEKMQVQYAGANRALLILRKDEFIEIKPDKMPIGGLQAEEKRLFTVKTQTLEKGDKLYLFSDGITDQFGGDPNGSSNGKKFKLSRLREKLMQYNSLTMSEQGQRIHDELMAWKGNYEQTDDICLIGISVD